MMILPYFVENSSICISFCDRFIDAFALPFKWNYTGNLLKFLG